LLARRNKAWRPAYRETIGNERTNNEKDGTLFEIY
jgi:hypothetical protein